MEDKIVDFVTRNYRCKYDGPMSDGYYRFILDKDNTQILFCWNGESLWGPYVCDASSPTSFKLEDE